MTKENFNGYTSREIDTEFQINSIVTDRKEVSEEPEDDKPRSFT
jgi:hypothetical protein